MSTRAARLAVLGVVVVTVLSGCADEAAPSVTVPHTATEATVAVGEVLVVDFGTVNPSIGDEWRVSVPPDPELLTEVGEEHTEVEPGASGTYVELEYRFEALSPGTTTIGFEYSYRGVVGDPEGRAGSDPTPEIVVTVTD